MRQPVIPKHPTLSWLCNPRLIIRHVQAEGTAENSGCGPSDVGFGEEGGLGVMLESSLDQHFIPTWQVRNPKPFINTS